MIIDVPLSYQPMVGQDISITVSGRVTALAINPLAPATVVATIETDDSSECEYVGPGTHQKQDPFTATNGLPGSSY
jgi:hypothetical protein